MATTYYVSAASGNNANAGTSEGSSWATLTKAMSGVVAGDTVYVKSDGNYNEIATISITGTNSAPIRFVGYASTTGDNGQAIIDAQNTRVNCINDSLTTPNIYYVFENFICVSGTGDGVNISVLSTFWKNCQFKNNSANGFQGGMVLFEQCMFDSNSTDGLRLNNLSLLCIGCRFFNNGADGINQSAGTASAAFICLFCEFFSNGTIAINAGQQNGIMTAIVNCTIDGDNKDSTTGITLGNFRQLACIVNNIIYDCLTGISSSVNHGNACISRNNLINANTTPYTNFLTFTNEITSAPLFNNEGANDYRLTSASPAVASGYDANILEGF